MSDSQHQYEVPYIALTFKDNLHYFPDSKTKELYACFPDGEEEGEDESLLREAEATTTLNSCFSASKYKSFRKNIEQNVAIKGVTLRENSNSIDFNRNRTYSIVKTTKQRKRALTSSDYERLPKSTGVAKEIVYCYAEMQDLHSPPEVVQSRYIPHYQSYIPQQQRYVPPQKDDSLKQSRNDLRSLLSTRYNPNLSEKNTISVQIREKAKAYKFVKMHKKALGAEQTRLNCNLFSFLDSTLNKPDPAVSKCPSAKMEPIAKPIRLKPWK